MPFAAGCFHAGAQMVPVGTTAAADEGVPTFTIAADLGLPSNSLGSRLDAEGGGVQLPPRLPKVPEKLKVGPFSSVALGVTGGSLGAGMEVATPLGRAVNLRLGGSYGQVQHPLARGGVSYSTALGLRSGRGLVDWYPGRGGFHVSAGAMFLKGSVTGAGSVRAGAQFRLGGTTYVNSVDDPVTGTGTLRYPRTMAPMVLFGLGNLIPRSGRRLSMPIEIGGAYLGKPQSAIQLAGTACTTEGCFDAATDPAVQANLRGEIRKLNSDVSFLQVYPIVSVGLALRF